MDSAPSSLPFSTRDESAAVTGSVEDDGVLSVAAGLAKEAALLFQGGKFMECLRVLIQLSQKKENDPKVRHNIAIAENFQDGCSDPKRLIGALENILKQSEELVHTSGDNLEITSNDGRKSMVDTSVAMFNLAVIWFHLHDYDKSFSYLDTLYQNIEPIDEGAALRICLLLLDVALLFYHASRSADIISYMEKVLCVNDLIGQVENGTSAPQQSSFVSKATSLPSNSTAIDSSHPDPVAANTLENTLARTMSEEALEDESLQLLSALDISGQNLQGLSGNTSLPDLLRNHPEDSSVADVRLKLHIYKVRLLLLIGNLKAAKREVKIAMNLARGNDYPLALYLKSQLEYARGNHRKAIRLLMASSNRLDLGISSMHYNNLGCIYYQLGKYHTSGVFFSKALKSCLLLRKEKPPKLLTLSQDKSLLISYNCGMHLLASGRPFHAARCFQKTSFIFNNRPLLWLRIAECCLMALEKGLIMSNSSSPSRFDIRINVIGKGKWRHLALSRGHSTYGQLKYVRKGDSVVGDGKQPELSISLAQQCLVNALYLLDTSKAKCFGIGLPPGTMEPESKEIIYPSNHNMAGVGDPKESNVSSSPCEVISNVEVRVQKSEISSSASLQNSVIDFETICMKKNHMMKQAVLADLAYVELVLGNPSEALSMAKSLLELPECSKIYVFLGTIYAAEALCLLNQPKEAAERLMKYISSGNHVELPYSRQDCEKWKLEKVVDKDDPNSGQLVFHAVSSPDESHGLSMFSSPEEARGVLLANYAANFALLGDIDRAQHFVMKALSDIPKSPQATLTAIYLDLKRGKTQEAVEKLKQHNAVSFFSQGSSKFNESS